MDTLNRIRQEQQERYAKEREANKAKIEAMSDKTVVRCSQCGAWKIEKRSCYTPTCSKTNVQSVLAITQTL